MCNEYTPEQVLEFVRLIVQREHDWENSDSADDLVKGPISHNGLEALRILFPIGVQGLPR